MKLVIDIPENVRVAISRMGLLRIPDEMQKTVDKAIQHGTPLPIDSKWIPCSKKLPSDCGCDWVLAQIQEDNGYLWIPRVMEYRKSKDDWCGMDEDLGWLKNHNGAFKVIAWMPLPEPYKGEQE